MGTLQVRLLFHWRSAAQQGIYRVWLRPNNHGAKHILIFIFIRLARTPVIKPFLLCGQLGALGGVSKVLARSAGTMCAAGQSLSSELLGSPAQALGFL